ncbi:ANXA7-like protein [Mya arenaria]|uniref:Annexin n=1 Tax=Mya arenaria TaxID=6604 RepID=A0ABY7DFC8_MYAAR|nr:ANXA7-like protein [Mya arenaria]
MSYYGQGPPGGYPGQAPGYPQPGGAPGYPQQPGYPQPGGSPYGQPTVKSVSEYKRRNVINDDLMLWFLQNRRTLAYRVLTEAARSLIAIIEIDNAFKVGMPTPESASAAAYGQPGGGMPYGSAPPGGMPGSVGFGSSPAPGGYGAPPSVAMPGGQPGYPQSGGYGAPQPGGYAPPTSGYNPGYGAPPASQAGGAGYPQPGAPPAGGSYPQPGGGYPGAPSQGGYGAPPAQGGYGAPGQVPPSQGGYGQPSAPAQGGYGQPGAPAQGGYGQPGAPPSAPGGMAYAGNVAQGHNVTALGSGGANMGYKVREDPTLRPAPNFNPENDAKLLRKAMKGFGTMTKSQQQHIKQVYNTCFGKVVMVLVSLSSVFKHWRLSEKTSFTIRKSDGHEGGQAGKSDWHKGRQEIQMGTWAGRWEIQMGTKVGRQESQRGMKKGRRKNQMGTKAGECENQMGTRVGRQDLIQDLKSELGGHFEDVIIALMMTETEFDAYELKRAMRSFLWKNKSKSPKNEDAMIEILCSRNNRQIQEINATYQRMYRTKLESDIVSDTSGHFKRLMVSMANGGRMENQTVDVNKANADAQALHQAGEKRWGTDESSFNAIFASQSFEQLRAVFDAYTRVAGRDIEQAVKSEMSGNLEIGIRAIIKCVRNKPGYFAEKLYRSMKGAGTDDRTLIRVIVTRAEVDMVQIKQEFQKMYGQTLDQFIRSDTSGDYRRIMLGMIGAGC